MSRRTDRKPYRIIGAYDSETTNISKGFSKRAFPILHQLGLLDCPIEEVHSSDVEGHVTVSMYRHAVEIYARFDDIAAQELPYVPVICCHNLSFDMWGLSPWLASKQVRVLAKSQQKPISFTILSEEDGKTPRLVIWDTLVFAQKSLAYMGDECGYPKLVGDWDYDLVRTPETPLSDEEKAYAAHDIYSLLAWLGYWCRLNPDIDPEMLGRRVVTKTGVVRMRREQRFSKLKAKGTKSVGQMWMQTNGFNSFDTDEELFTCNAATRGGFTFCSSKNASRVFDFAEDSPYRVYGFDATSQHPSQMVSHMYPQGFEETSGEVLMTCFQIVQCKTLDDVLSHYDKPFPKAFYGLFEFENLRLKEGSCFEKWGVAPLAWARCKPYAVDTELFEDNQQAEEFKVEMSQRGYNDEVLKPVYAFGKLESAGKARLYLTELAAWEVCQAYDFDSVKGISGYVTGRFYRPTDMSVISVMQFYAAKNAFKHARAKYYENEPLDNIEDLRTYHIPDFVIDGMVHHEIDDSTVESTYLGLKADLNALFGIEACNEYRRDTVLGDTGIEYEGDFGVCNKPKNPKAFYQFGQRVVGWSRIAQIVVMELAAPYIETIVNGDTDSVKMVIRDDNLPEVMQALSRMDAAIDSSKDSVCSRVKWKYPRCYDSLDGIGHYILEFSTRKFCASWNKAYCICEEDKRDGREHMKFTLAGVPVKTGYAQGHGVNAMADRMIAEGQSFGEVCDTLLGYNVTYMNDITGLNARSFPKWADVFAEEVTDYRGETSRVAEPCALCLYPMAKTVNDCGNRENAVNMERALENRPSVHTDSMMISNDGIESLEEIVYGK